MGKVNDIHVVEMQLLTAIRNTWKMYWEVLLYFPHFNVHVTVICRQLTGSLTPQISTSQPVVMPSLSIANWCNDLDLPRFSRSTQLAIDRSQITKNATIEVISALLQEIWIHTEYPKSAEYTHLCKKLIRNYP